MFDCDRKWEFEDIRDKVFFLRKLEEFLYLFLGLWVIKKEKKGKE